MGFQEQQNAPPVRKRQRQSALKRTASIEPLFVNVTSDRLFDPLLRVPAAALSWIFKAELR